MPLLGRATLKGSCEIGDFDHFGWWKALVSKGIQPSEAWQMDFIESSLLFECDPKTNDISLALYHQRLCNGMPR